MTQKPNIYIVSCCVMSFLLFCYSFQKASVSSSIQNNEYIQQFKTTRRTKLLDNELLVCTNNLLDKSKYRYKKCDGASTSYNTYQLIPSQPNRPTCRAVKYTTEKVILCFDALYKEHMLSLSLNIRNHTKDPTELYFVFMGDSRMRQQYYNFIELIPNYDRQTQPYHIKQNEHLFNHGDVDWYSSILSLQVSFKWRPIINDTVMEMIHQWAVSDYRQRPSLVLLSTLTSINNDTGMEVHHMLIENGNDFQLYKKTIRKFGQTLELLASVSKVIWLNQYPIIDFFGPTDGHNTDIHSKKVHQYNEAVQRILRNFTSIRIWDSSNTLAEEYIRGCTIFAERSIRFPLFQKEGQPFNPINCKPYISCLDFVHTGYVALSQATQILFNDICNAKLYIDS